MPYRPLEETSNPGFPALAPGRCVRGPCRRIRPLNPGPVPTSPDHQEGPQLFEGLGPYPRDIQQLVH